MVATLGEAQGDEIEAVAREMTPCEYCRPSHYAESVHGELMKRALIGLIERGRLERLKTIGD